VSRFKGQRVGKPLANVKDLTKRLALAETILMRLLERDNLALAFSKDNGVQLVDRFVLAAMEADKPEPELEMSVIEEASVAP
jgi:hypothetical protein